MIRILYISNSIDNRFQVSFFIQKGGGICLCLLKLLLPVWKLQRKRFQSAITERFLFSVLGSSTFPFLSLKLFIRVIRYIGLWIFRITRKIHYLRNSVRREEKIALILRLLCCVAKFPNTRTFDVKLRMLERLSKFSSPPFRALFPLASLLDTHSVRSFRIFPQICLSVDILSWSVA